MCWSNYAFPSRIFELFKTRPNSVHTPFSEGGVKLNFVFHEKLWDFIYILVVKYGVEFYLFEERGRVIKLTWLCLSLSDLLSAHDFFFQHSQEKIKKNYIGGFHLKHF